MGWGEYKIEVKGKEEANQLLIEMIKEFRLYKNYTK